VRLSGGKVTPVTTTEPGPVADHDVVEPIALPALDREDQERFRRVLADAQEALREAAVPFALLGGVASCVYGRPRWTHDIDIFVRPHDARNALGVLADAGFETARHDETWIYKAVKDDVLVDVLFKAEGDVYFDDEMAGRSRQVEFEGVAVTAVAPEDLLIVKVLAHKEETSRYWFDALSIVARSDLDWGYLLRRARIAPARVLSLLVYAVSSGMAIPPGPVAQLVAEAFPSPPET